MTTATVAEMESRHHWFRRLDAEHRSWITLVAQAGIDGFVTWFAAPDPQAPSTAGRLRLGTAGAGPADLALPDRRAGADHDRRGREPDRRGDAQGRPADPARGDRPVQPRGGLLRRRGLRPGGRAARGLGRAAGGPGGRRGAARRDRRDGAVPGLDPGLARDRERRGGGRAGAGPGAGAGAGVHPAHRRDRRCGHARRRPGRPDGRRARRPALWPPTGSVEVVVGKFAHLFGPGRGGRRTAGRAPDGRGDQHPGGAGRLPGRRRLAGGPATGRRRRPAARAGAVRRRARPPGPGPRASTSRCSPPAAGCWRPW